MIRETLPLFWWLRQRQYDNQPHAYVCPLLMTISALIHRLRGKHAYWRPARPDTTGDEEWLTLARVVIGHCEARCLFPRWLIEAECDFWNSRIGLRLRSR